MKKFNKIGLHYNPNGNPLSGPGKVCHNLRLGLLSLGYYVKDNAVCDINGCLQSDIRQYMTLPKKTLMGPNLFVIPSEHPHAFRAYDNFVCPSEWVKSLYVTYEVTKGKNIFVWSVGIDTNYFNDSNKNINFDCLLYVKNTTNQVSQEKIKAVIDNLNNNKLSYKVLEYGKYKNDDLIQLTKNCRFCILLTGTESQGIAYMEILSSGIPCYVIDQTIFSYNGITFPATSVPYFNDKCGVIDNMEMKSFTFFLDNVNNFSPRDYILSNHTLEISANKYLDILSESQGVLE